MKTIRLHGELGKRFGREFTLDVRTPAEAVRALGSQLPGFRQYLHQHADDYYKVFVSGRSVGEDELPHPTSDKEVIRIVPVIQGAGGGFGKVILGAALIALSFVPGLQAISFGFLGQTFTMAGIVGNIGMSLLLGGVAQMLSPTQKTPGAETKERPDNKPSYNFDGAVNTLAQGHPVPVCYGKMLVGSQVISAGLVTK